MKFSHPLSKYGLALVMYKEHISSAEQITPQMLAKHLREGLNRFRLFTSQNPDIDSELIFDYLTMDYIISNNQKGDTNKGIYLSPNILTTDFQAGKCWDATVNLIKELGSMMDKSELTRNRKDLTQSIAPIAGKFNNGSNSQSTPKSSYLEVACCAITTVTALKPCKLIGLTPSAIVPDLDIPDMVNFINVFSMMAESETSNLLKYKVRREIRKKGGKSKGKKQKYHRPPIINGNFPDAPRNDAFGNIALLSAIGKWSNRAENSDIGLDLLERLKNVPFYTISYGDASVSTYSNFLIGLAKENKLGSIVSAILRSEILSEKERRHDSTKYQLFDMLAGRFLQFFDKSSFLDFLSIRAEYRNEINFLFTLFFEKQMKIRPEVVDSAQKLGSWLNNVAFLAAKEESKDKPDKLRDFKSKAIIQIESAAFSSKTCTDLISQTLTRAGRLSGQEAPFESVVFLKAVATEEISLKDAQNLITAFLRVRNRHESSEKSLLSTESQQSVGLEDDENLSDAQH